MHGSARETLINSISQAEFADWDEMQGTKRSNSGTIASICNAADRPIRKFLRHEELIRVSLVST